MNILRHQPAGVLPLELWDIAIEGTPLYLVPAADQPRAIANALASLRSGRALRFRGQRPLPALVAESVVVAGGGPVDAVVRALSEAGFAAKSAHDPIWIAELGAREILRAHGVTRGGAVLDVGQTSLKFSDDAERTRTWRDLTHVPLECDVPAALRAEFRERTVAFFASVLRARLPARALVLALPCEIGSDLRVAGCSYPWADGDATLIRDVLRAAHWQAVPTYVLNDAELAAMSVAKAPTSMGPTLVLTLGRGLGAAFLTRPAMPPLRT